MAETNIQIRNYETTTETSENFGYVVELIEDSKILNKNTFHATKKGGNWELNKNKEFIFNNTCRKTTANNLLYCMANEKAKEMQRELTPQIKDITKKLK